MRIPLAALGTPAPAEGTAFRVNLFRTEAPADDAKEITWSSAHEQYVFTHRSGLVCSDPSPADPRYDSE